VKKAIKKGEIQLNNQITHGGTWLNIDDIITVVDLELTPPKSYHLKLNIIFEDEDLAIIVKPAGINVSGNQFKTIQNALLFNITSSQKLDALNWPLPVHRLDNQTSGLLIIAKTKQARINLGQDFENKTSINKTYQAIVIGKMPLSGNINQPIDSKESITDYKLIKTVQSLKNNFLSLVELYPITGRTHQLRIHCTHIGHPILGDKIHGEPGLILKHKGLFLCAIGLKFKHPITEENLSFKIETPSKFIKRLENEARRFSAYSSSNNTETSSK